MKQTAVEFLQQALSIHFTHEQEMQFIGLFNQTLEMEKQQSQKYAEFAIHCDRNNLPILTFEDFIKL
jgi:hypothetical protein